MPLGILCTEPYASIVISVSGGMERLNFPMLTRDLCTAVVSLSLIRSVSSSAVRRAPSPMKFSRTLYLDLSLKCFFRVSMVA